MVDGKSCLKKKKQRGKVLKVSFQFQRLIIDSSQFLAHRDGGGRVSMAVYRCRKITISAVNGHAVCILLSTSITLLLLSLQAGIGLTALQLPFDLRFVWAGAKLTFPFVKRGIVPEGSF